MKDFHRRQVLKGIGGVTVGLPMLDVFRAHEAKAAGTSKKIYSVFVLQANGVLQKWNTEPEMFWPRADGPLSDDVMKGTDADRATSELAGYAKKLLMVRGLSFAFPGNGCGHSGGCNQVLTAAKVSDNPRGPKSMPMGESIDNRIARELTPGREPLALYAGRKSGYIDDAFSYRGALQVRAADNNPWTAYQRMVGLGSGAADQAAAQKLLARRKSVNDLLRGQVKELMGRKELSQADRDRLDLHFSSIRDMELGMVKLLDADKSKELQAINGQHRAPENMEKVMRLQADLIAFGLASDLARTATLQIGDGNDGTTYTIDGVKLPSYHQISHRIFSDGSDGAPIPDAVNMHHKIDRLHARAFKYLLDRLSERMLPDGTTLLDSSFAVWCNSLANGPPHSYSGVPYIIAGGAGGFLKTGMSVTLPAKTYNNKLFNTLLTAAGVKKPSGEPVDDFGDPSLAKGPLSQIHA